MRTVTRLYIDNAEQTDISGYIESATYTESVKKDNIAEFNFLPGIEPILDEGTLQAGVYLKFNYGLSGNVSPTKDLRVTDIDIDYGDYERITVRCLDDGNRMKKNSSRRLFSGKSSKEILETLASEMNLSTQFSGNLSKSWDSLPQANRSNMDMARYVLSHTDEKLILYIKNRVMIVEERGLDKDSALTLNKNDDNFLSFSPRLRESSSDGALNSTEVVGPDGSESNTVDDGAEVNLGDYKIKISANGVVVDDNGVEVIEETPTLESASQEISEFYKKAISLPTADSKEAKAKAGSHRQGKFVMSGRLTTIGNPFAELGEIVTLTGLRSMHEGNWYTESVSHNLSSSSYTTDRDMVKNGSKVGSVSSTSKNDTVGPDQSEEPTVTIDGITGEIQ